MRQRWILCAATAAVASNAETTLSRTEAVARTGSVVVAVRDKYKVKCFLVKDFGLWKRGAVLSRLATQTKLLAQTLATPG